MDCAESDETTQETMAAGYLCTSLSDGCTRSFFYLHVKEQGSDSGTEQNLCGGLCPTDGKPYRQ